MKNKKRANESSLLVTQSNNLVESRYNLSLSEQRLILLMISYIQPDDEDFKPYVISIHNFANFLGISHNSMYSECKKITKVLLSRVVEIQEENRFFQTHWVSSAEYEDGTGMVNLCFDPLLKPYLLQIKSGFTSCRLEMLLSFKSQYTMRFYMLIRQYEKIKVREVSLGNLRELIGLGKKQYPQFSDLKKRILIPVQKELREKSDLYFEFEEIKYGRRVEMIRFTIFRNQKLSIPKVDTKIIVEQSLQSELLEEKVPSLMTKFLLLVPERHRAKKTVYSAIELALKKHNETYVKRNILYANEKAKNSYAGFLNQTLKQDWGHDWEIDQEETEQVKVFEIWEKHGFSSQKDYDNAMYRQQMNRYGKNIDL